MDELRLISDPYRSGEAVFGVWLIIIRDPDKTDNQCAISGANLIESLVLRDKATQYHNGGQRGKSVAIRGDPAVVGALRGDPVWY